MHESHHIKLTVYHGSDEVIGWVHPVNVLKAHFGLPWFAVPHTGKLDNRYFRNLDEAVEAIRDHHMNGDAKRKEQVKSDAVDEVTGAINDLHDELFKLGINDLCIESLLESYLDPTDLIRSIRDLPLSEIT